MFLTENKIIRPVVKGENMDYEKIVRDLDLQSENIYEEILVNGSRKRMRLHQLSWEEKLQRKKLRNRIAAQTSRDRKKAKMDHLEEAVKDLKQQNDLLFLQIEELQKKNEMLIDANAELQKTLNERSYTCSCTTRSNVKEDGEKFNKLNEVQSQICVKDDQLFERPAESSRFPQQKGQWTTLAQEATRKPSWTLWRIFLLYLLSQKCWQISRETHSSMTLKDWQQACWKKLSSMKTKETNHLFSVRLQELANRNAFLIMKWWGKHQKSWNPVEVK